MVSLPENGLEYQKGICYTLLRIKTDRGVYYEIIQGYQAEL
jgi:hypothetical protein